MIFFVLLLTKQFLTTFFECFLACILACSFRRKLKNITNYLFLRYFYRAIAILSANISLQKKKKKNTLRVYIQNGLYSLYLLKFKQNLINCLLHCANTICSSYIGIHKQFEFIATMLLKNGYPLNFIQTEICRFLDSKHQICDSKPPNKNLRGMNFKLLYIGNPSVHLEKELQSFYRRKLGKKVRLAVSHSTFGIENRFR